MRGARLGASAVPRRPLRGRLAAAGREGVPGRLRGQLGERFSRSGGGA
jgi:hypothetical protein